MHGWKQVFTNEVMLRYAFDMPPTSAPGEAFNYCNTNFGLLGLAIESITGLPFDTVLENKILLPLGLNDTYYSSIDPYPVGLVRGYTDVDLNGHVEDSSCYQDGLRSPAGGVVSSVWDLKIFIEALLKYRILLSDKSLTEMQTWVPAGIVADGYGLGLFIRGNNIGHTGGVVGYSSEVLYNPVTDVTMVTLVN